MAKQTEDLKEKAPCGMIIHYTVNGDDVITYNDINGRGVQCAECEGCTWKGICKPKSEKKMSHKLYIEILNLIDDAINHAGEECEKACDTIANEYTDLTDPAAIRAFEKIKENRRRYHEMNELLERFKEEVDEPQK